MLGAVAFHSPVTLQAGGPGTTKEETVRPKEAPREPDTSTGSVD